MEQLFIIFKTKPKNYQNCFPGKKLNPINSIDPLIIRLASTWHWNTVLFQIAIPIKAFHLDLM